MSGASATSAEGQASPELCAEFNDRLRTIDLEATALEERIRGARGKNQAAGYFGTFFIVPLIAVEGHEREKVRLDELQRQRDEVYVKKRQYACTSASSK